MRQDRTRNEKNRQTYYNTTHMRLCHSIKAG